MDRVEEEYYDMIPLEEIADILAPIFKVGAEKGHERDGWEKIEPSIHLGRGIAHFGHAMACTNIDEDNLAHMMWRVVIGVVIIKRRERECLTK